MIPGTSNKQQMFAPSCMTVVRSRFYVTPASHYCLIDFFVSPCGRYSFTVILLAFAFRIEF